MYEEYERICNGKGDPSALQTAHVTKPPMTAAIIPCEVAFFQYSAASAGIPAAAAWKL